MRITTQAEYGLICALHLARRAADGPVTGRDIAAGERLPSDYVEQIMLKLRRADIVRSTRGARGGYQLARPAASINAAEIIDAVEGPVALTECAGGAGNCGIEATCLVGHGWQRISRAIRHALVDVSLEELLRRDSVFAAPDLMRLPAARTQARG